MQLIFDGHNDALSRLWCAGGDPVARFATAEGQVNAPGARAGGFGGGMFALFSPPRRVAFDFAALKGNPAAMPGPVPLDQPAALASVMAELGVARRLADAGAITLCTCRAQIDAAMAHGQIAAVLHLEGAECIDPELLVLDALYAMGLRSLGPVWSRPTIWGEGVPFRWGVDGNTGPGLTPDGKRLVERCAALGMVVDTSHLTMQGFWDIGAMGLPLVATHSNAFDICPTTRNLTGDQLRAIGESGGMAGLNYATFFLTSDGWRTGRADIDACLRQLDAMIEAAGEDHVGLGSDFDGAPMPQGLATVADLQNLVAAIETHGFGTVLTAKLCKDNWLGFLGRVLKG